MEDEYKNINYEALDGKFVDARELVSYLVASIRNENYQDISTACYEGVIGFVFSHLESR